MKAKMGFCVVAAVVAGAALAAKPLAKFDGEVGAKSGWKLVAQEAGKVVYIPFEGYYESKGGRIESGKIVLDKKVGETGYYKLSFDAKAEVQGYWWIDLFDEKGEMLPDINSAVYASSDWQHYDELFTVDPRAAQVQIAFVAKKGVFAKDVVLTRVSVAEAADWCNDFYATLPQMDRADLDAVTSNAFKKLPRTLDALRTGKPLKVVLLGDSIMNDTYCGNFTALVQNDYPAANPQFTISVRGSTGCWYYHNAQHFVDYVARHSPDLVLIGGISNPLHPEEGSFADCMVETIERCKKLGAEVAVCSPPPSYEFRTSPDQTTWSFGMKTPGNAACLQNDFELEAVRRTDVEYWDVTTAAANAIARSRKPLNWWKRDGAHNDDRGKQLIAQTVAEFFRAALRGARCAWQQASSESGWRRCADGGFETARVPTTGCLDGRGGRLESPKFRLPKADPKAGGSFYGFRFFAKGLEDGTWRIDLFDERGRRLSDISSTCYVSPEYPKHDPQPVVFAPDARAVYAKAVFCGGNLTVRDISIREITHYEAAETADLIYKTLPRLDFKPAPGAFDKLPKTLDALKAGKPLRVVLLGDSLADDCCGGLASALVKRDFPASKFEFFNAACASAKASVADLKPDLAIVGVRDGTETDVAEAIGRCRATGAEVVCLTPAAGKADVAFWDVQTPVRAAMKRSGHDERWFKRDGARLNDRGKQLVARALQMFFREAVAERAPLAFDRPSPENGWRVGNYGRLESRLYLLPDRKPGHTDFYRMTFKAKVPRKTNVRPGNSDEWCGYCWVDCFDKDGIQLPDMNTQIGPSADWKDYDELFTVREDAVCCQISLCCSLPGAEFKDIRFEKISDAEAAVWCDRLNAQIPQLTVKPKPGAFDLLPRTKAKLLRNEPLRIVFLGDSLMNDTYLGGIPALLRRAFPKTECIISVRSSTGCWYYSDPAHFNEYVRSWKPDLLVIGGISHLCNEKTYGKVEDTMNRLLELCASCRGEFETVVQTPPVSLEWRKSPEETAFKGDEVATFKRDYMFSLGRKHGIAVWECTTGPGKAWAESKKPLNWFKRDYVHLNDYGKHLVSRMLFSYFETLK